jgi:hypothetical protein
LANYTLALVIVGGLQVIGLIVQGVFLFRAFRETRAATGLTRDSNTEVIRANAATEGLAKESNKITRDSTDLTRQSLLLVHRPKLSVYGVILTGGENALAVKSLAEGSFYVVNNGGTAATITEVYATVKVYSSLPMKAVYTGIPGYITTPVTLAAGELRRFPFSKEDGAITDNELTGHWIA